MGDRYPPFREMPSKASNFCLASVSSHRAIQWGLITVSLLLAGSRFDHIPSEYIQEFTSSARSRAAYLLHEFPASGVHGILGEEEG